MIDENDVASAALRATEDLGAKRGGLRRTDVSPVVWFVLLFGFLMGGLSYVNGRWFDGRLRGPSARTLPQVLRDAAIAGAMALAFILVLVVWSKVDRRRERRHNKRRPEPDSLALYGFLGDPAHEGRQPTWEVDPLPDGEAAEAEAYRWLNQQPPDAYVELVAFSGDAGHVIMVITAEGSERVD